MPRCDRRCSVIAELDFFPLFSSFPSSTISSLSLSYCFARPILDASTNACTTVSIFLALFSLFLFSLPSLFVYMMGPRRVYLTPRTTNEESEPRASHFSYLVSSSSYPLTCSTLHADYLHHSETNPFSLCVCVCVPCYAAINVPYSIINAYKSNNNNNKNMSHIFSK